MASQRKVIRDIGLYEERYKKGEWIKMGCKISFEQLSLYLDGRCAEQEAQTLKDHISVCPRCKEQLGRLGALKASLHDLPEIKESEGFDFEFNRLLQQRLTEQAAPSWKVRLEGSLARIRDSVAYPVPALVKVAASFIVVISLALGMRYQAIQKIPVVEFVAGPVEVYSQAKGEWVAPEIDMRLKAGDKIRCQEGGVFHIASRNKYKARIKDDSLIVLSKLDSGWRNIDTDFGISYGNLLVNTTDKFKGSHMKIQTPACDAEVVGTAFMIKVLPEPENETWLGVLEGKVKVLAKAHPLKELDMQKAITYVSSGQKVVVKAYSYPTIPELFSEKEWRMVQELYQLTDKPEIILLVGTSSDRIEELLKPAPVYISGITGRTVPKQIDRAIAVVIEAAQQDDHRLLYKSLRELENLLTRYPNPQYDVEILMFIASYYHYTGDYEDALRIFEKVVKSYPDSDLASLAQCGIATIYQKDLKDIKRAENAYQALVNTYPDSVDAVRAKEVLRTIR
jgi:hypothetical protein